MKSVTLNLGTAESVKHFVNVTNKFDYDMDLRSGRHVVDAKSILGIFSLDLSTPVVLEVFSDNYADSVKASPVSTPISRPDEVLAARKPCVKRR